MRYLQIFFLITIIQLNSFAQNIEVGAAQLNQYLPLLQNKNIGLVVNQTSTIGQTHLLDTLLKLNIKVKKVFAPEHGFRGVADAGEHVKNGIDPSTNTPIISLYGNNKKPKAEQIKDLDILIFDIQDIGVRFYTYISTLQYVMEACAENKKKLIILDRPNPNGHYVDGPILDTQYRSFVGMQQIPIVHGMTVGEYAKMLNGEKWLSNKLQCNITIIPCRNYDHKTFYQLPIKPSPNLPNMQSIYLYPSLCLFEGTDHVSLGRGTTLPFQIYGSPSFPKTLNYQFTPQSLPGAKTPPQLNQQCFGYNLSEISLTELQKNKFTLKYFINAYQLTNNKTTFFNTFFVKLYGKGNLSTQLKNKMTEAEIRKTWQQGLQKFKTIRKKYLLYKDFE
ncbi:MAG: DUF1343 domain-containing protein [Sphingobacteriales bacterium]|nr:MAG: DUF1343 domain-containing protein [Sphingobacteriales bacterium]